MTFREYLSVLVQQVIVRVRATDQAAAEPGTRAAVAEVAVALIASQKPKVLRELPVLDMEYPFKCQGVVWSAGNWWVMNTETGVSGSGGRETPHVGRFTEKGAYLGRMTFTGAGHGSVFAMDGTTVVLGWDRADGKRYIRRVAWTKNRKISESQAALLDTGRDDCYPLPLDGEYLTLAVRNDTYMWFYQRKYADPKTNLRTIRVPVYKSSNNTQGPAMQGAFSFGKNVFVQWGWPKDRPQRLDQYEWGAAVGSTVNYTKPLSSLDITKFGLDSNDTSTEPEGIAAYNGRLIIGKQYNGHKKRAFRAPVCDGVTRDAIAVPKPPPSVPGVPAQPPWPPVPPPKPTPPTKCGLPPVVTTGLTGASGTGTGNGQFGAWRGTPVTAVGTWINDPAIYPFGPKIPGCTDCGMYETWDGAADIGITPAVWQGWDAEAAGVNDEYWRDIGNNLRFFWAERPRGAWYLRPYYEANGDWFEYAIKDKASAFKTAFARTTKILREEFPESQIMFGVACSTPGTNRPTVSSIWPADTSFDALSLDFYNTFPWVNTVPAFNTKIVSGAGANSLEPLRVLAQQHGKAVVLSEWGSASVDNGGGGGDAPEFFTGMRNWITTNQGLGPGKVLMDVYFNVTNGYPEQYWLWSTVASARQPLAAARDAALW